MRALSKLFNPLRQAAEVFFKHDVALRRDAAGLQIVLEAKAEPSVDRKKKPKGKPDPASLREKEELALMLEQLGALLAELPTTRAAMRHLGFVEHALRKKGLRALGKLPLEVLQRALEQLESLVTNWSPAGLANLRSKMAVAIIEREHMAPDDKAAAEAHAAAADDLADGPSGLRPLPLVQESSEDDDALAAAYAALGNLAPSEGIEMQGELGSRSAKSVAPPLPRVGETAGDIQLREVEA